MYETWYVLESGDAVHPDEVAPGDDGVLRHTSGVAVAMRGQVPHSTGVDTSKRKAKAEEPEAAKAVEPAQAKRYKTRELKGR